MTGDKVAEKVRAAIAIMSEPELTLAKAQSILTLLSGINTKLDRLVRASTKALGTLELATSGAYIELVAEQIPETTPEEKKRKKTLLFFIQSWENLGREVLRIESLINNGQSVTDSSFWSAVLVGAKGPFAAVTLLAVVAVGLHFTSTTISIESDGCPPLTAERGVTLPGMVIPGEALRPGHVVEMRLPPIPITVDGMTPGKISLTSPVFHFDFTITDAVTNVTFNGTSMIGRTLPVSLSDQPLHRMRVICE